MKLHPLIIGLLVVITSPASFAASVLDIPSSVDVLLLNGQQLDTDEVTLVEGDNQLLFRYQVNYRDSGMQTQFKSEAVIVKFSASNDTYRLKLPSIRNRNAANSFNKSPQLTLTNSQGLPVEFIQDLLLKDGLQLGRDFELELSQYNLSNKPAAMSFTPLSVDNANLATKPALTAAPTITSTATITPASTTTAAPATVAAAPALTPTAITPKTIAQDQAEITEMLDYWYSKANQETRAKFKAKINQQ
ncbi:DUF2057 domain-containing protein [Shewanella sp. 10N.286.52.B9]|uniref:YccT family protein n=1 Tax=Shewanella sp. 10N.286.52.B9 TaxID=1880837 RepID=UPI000CA7FD68|nr:DUF2057 domain-containing protein [Shewanella sp. 10N.286.52.B9]PMG40209.1 hypothetical protein BCU91_13840 [Shewanella sp. 10N.286.52.B9]